MTPVSPAPHPIDRRGVLQIRSLEIISCVKRRAPISPSIVVSREGEALVFPTADRTPMLS